MAIATCLPNAESFSETAFSAALAEDTLALAAEIADAVQVLEQCRARNVVPTDEFLEYVDRLMERGTVLHAGGAVYVA